MIDISYLFFDARSLWEFDGKMWKVERLKEGRYSDRDDVVDVIDEMMLLGG
jgi:hypothetical protein